MSTIRIKVLLETKKYTEKVKVKKSYYHDQQLNQS